jgi:hypothetical protein
MKLLVYSFFSSLCIVALANFLYSFGGRFVMEPGVSAEFLLTGIILLVVPSGDHYFRFPDGTDVVLTTIIYTGVVFVAVKMWASRKPV